MGKYIVKRILQVIPMLFILSLIVFMMVRLIPGDPVDMMLGMDIPKDTKEYERERLGLNDPLYIQYFRFVGNALHGDLGTSIFSGKPVVEELAKRFPKTLTLAVGGTLFGAAVGVLLGIIAAIHRNKFADNLIMVLSLLTVSTPSFFLALILMLIFCLNLRWLPVSAWIHGRELFSRLLPLACKQSAALRAPRAARCWTLSIRTISARLVPAACRSA
ncbi:MAG TPA: ABC transporter permease [Clostridiales bacterium]|nr:ABC transporter permease [Clostridiales bacterium]